MIHLHQRRRRGGEQQVAVSIMKFLHLQETYTIISSSESRALAHCEEEEKRQYSAALARNVRKRLFPHLTFLLVWHQREQVFETKQMKTKTLS